MAVARAWGEEIDRRAERASSGRANALSREQFNALLEMPPEEARARLAQVLASRK